MREKNTTTVRVIGLPVQYFYLVEATAERVYLHRPMFIFISSFICFDRISFFFFQIHTCWSSIILHVYLPKLNYIAIIKLYCMY